MSEQDKLLPCGCGGEQITYVEPISAIHHVECECGVVARASSENEVFEVWNRAMPHGLKGLIQDLAVAHRMSHEPSCDTSHWLEEFDRLLQSNNTRPQPAPDGDVVEQVTRSLVYASLESTNLEHLARAAIAAMQPAIDKARADAKAEERARWGSLIKEMAVAHEMSHTEFCDESYWRGEFDRKYKKAIEQGGGDAS